MNSSNNPALGADCDNQGETSNFDQLQTRLGLHPSGWEDQSNDWLQPSAGYDFLREIGETGSSTSLEVFDTLLESSMDFDTNTEFQSVISPKDPETSFLNNFI